MKKVYLILFCLVMGLRLTAQISTISTTANYLNNNGSGIVTFNFQNCHYPVERDVAEQVAAASGGLAALQAAAAVLPDAQGLESHVRLDIRGAQRLQLLAAGLQESQISSCPLCTVEEPLLFHSWRRDQQKAVQWSGIVSQQLDPD